MQAKTIVKQIDKTLDNLYSDIEETKQKNNLTLFKTLSEAAMHLKQAKDYVYNTIEDK
jgi:uncharacterized protein (DUF1810 family)